ncbi:hypothetical protein [Brachyspira hyodysenteriae]|uniref:hypothetical protein n=1 Tax=Brachyspira hyodysenteriae TaxID=159 RepID=UPI00063DA341|nr:hypothetical protein [Brachyspira hyodysenteriae]KLI15582.1 hypothetical protein SU45_09775 [Brachyspira hyodysenteriae]KLI54240.1 hypothetical protein SZ43_04350 [Brachyspira hyodysenteriae]KLI58832.1 hypothetical protein SZ46_09705 [Brachyspira hyodysenteriae]MCZ9850195.1 hypothetical protein [Brachyspira hyodysenteriae]MCZ9878165.1 hypothetical protein [Brachyspira hyodysenteriae]
MKYKVELFGLDGCHKHGYTVYIKGKKNFYNFLEQYKKDIKEKNINRYIQYKNHYVIYNKDIIQKFGLYAIYQKIPYLKRGEKTYKDNKYYYIYFYKTLIVKLDLDKLQDIWDKRRANGKEKSFGYLRFALGGFGKYIDYALEYYCYFVLGIKPKEL